METAQAAITPDANAPTSSSLAKQKQKTGQQRLALTFFVFSSGNCVLLLLSTFKPYKPAWS
jgi:hypothetical protein